MPDEKRKPSENLPEECGSNTFQVDSTIYAFICLGSHVHSWWVCSILFDLIDSLTDSFTLVPGLLTSLQASAVVCMYQMKRFEKLNLDITILLDISALHGFLALVLHMITGATTISLDLPAGFLCESQ